MDAYSMIYLFNAAAVSLLGILMLLGKARSQVHRNWGFLSLAAGGWCLGTFFLSISGTENRALLWFRVLNYFALFLGPLFIQFCYSLIGRKFENRFRLPLYGIAFALVLWGFIFPQNLIISMRPDTGPRFVPKVGGLFHGYAFYFLTCAVFSLIFIARQFRQARAAHRNQLKYLFFSMTIALSGLSATFLICYGVEFPYGSYLFSLCTFVMAYAVVVRRLPDAEAVAKKVLVFAGLFCFGFGFFSLLLLTGQKIVVDYLGSDLKWVVGLGILIILLGYEPVRGFLVRMTDRYFFHERYDYQKLLRDATRGISKIENLNHLLSLVVHFVTRRMRVANAAILSKNGQEYRLGHQRGYEKNFLEYALKEDNPFIRHLASEKEAIDVTKIKKSIEDSTKKASMPDYDFGEILRIMGELEADCCVPSFLGQELRNILVLGEKKSGAAYDEEDLNLLFTLAQESAIAIENARLYDEAINKTRELEQINSQLEYAKNLLMKALRETEVANKQLQDTQAQLIHEQKMATLGRLAASVGHEVNNPLTILSMNVSRVLLKLRKNPDLRVTEITDTFEKMEQNIGRIKAVVNTLTGLLKKSEKGKFEPLSLKLVLEETLPLVQFQTYLDNLTGTEVEFNVPGSLPLIRGDLERLQEVFLNLFINAYHAMEGRGNRRISVSAERDPSDSDFVMIRFSDNGKGMTKETANKIFNYGYTTKAPGRGSGLGLYMCKYIIELHGGGIKVESVPGEGTVFTIHLPAVRDTTARTDEARMSAG